MVEPVTPQPGARELYDRRARSNGGLRSVTPVDQRYRPNPATKPIAGTDPAPRTQPAPRGLGGGVTASRPAPGPIVSAPRSSAPRLTPRPVNPTRATNLLEGRRMGGGAIGTHIGSVYDPWNGFWDPCYSYGYHRGRHWGYPMHCGHGGFGFSWSLWYPWWYWQSYTWSVGYYDCWWDTWSRPCYASSSYWWYPRSTYCPTYLYVPSTVLVVERDNVPAPDAAPAPDAVPAAAPAAAPAPAPAPGVGARMLPPVELAKKYVELGDFYFKAGRYSEAADAYARARTYAPDDGSVHFVLADAAFATGDFHFAAFLIAEAVRLDPTMVAADTDKRLFYGDPAQFEAQMQALDQYLASKPYDAQAHLVRGYNLRFSGKQAAAIAAFRRVLEISPDNVTAKAFLAAIAPTEKVAPTDR